MESPKKLSTDALALIHHVQLNKTGWLEKATSEAIRFILWLSETPTTAKEITDRQGQVNISHLTEQSTNSILKQMVIDDACIENPSDHFLLSTEDIKLLNDSVSKAQETEELIKHKIITVALIENQSDLDPETLWIDFHKDFIVPYIQKFGAKSYELISGDAPKTSENSLPNFLSSFPESQQGLYEKMALALFDPDSIACKTYAIRLLNAYYYGAATQLPDKTIEQLFGENAPSKQLRLVLDTNFLFSLLKLHDNPSNESVNTLLDIIKHLPKSLKVGLYVLPATIDEFRRALVSFEQKASNIQLSKNIIIAGAQNNIPGVVQTYFKRCIETDTNISPEDYFAPYHEDFSSILHDHGVEIFQIPDNRYDQDQRVIDDALHQQSYYKRKYLLEPKRVKRYEQIWHDVALWYAISDKRSGVNGTIFEADWIGVTIDYSLINFDAHKRRNDHSIPIIMHPASLVQALQLLLPTSNNIEEAIFEIMRMPFLFDNFDGQGEQSSLRILENISRYENIDNMSIETITSILTNQALREKISSVNTTEEEMELIEAAFLEHVKEADEKLITSEKSLEVANNKLVQKEVIIADLNENVDKTEATAQVERGKFEKLNAKNQRLESVLVYSLTIVGVAFCFGSSYLLYLLLGENLNAITNPILSKLPLFSVWPFIIKIINTVLKIYIQKSSHWLFFTINWSNRISWKLLLFITAILISPMITEAYQQYNGNLD